MIIPTPMLDQLKASNYRLGDLQALAYDRSKPEIFFDGYVSHLYRRCKTSKVTRGSKMGILEVLFCGMPDLSHDAITSYLMSRGIVVLGEWRGDSFREKGFIFPTTPLIGPEGGKQMFAGYGFFRDTWGTREQELLAMLGIAFLFREFGLAALHGVRYATNEFTARFLSRFGFREVGRIPRYQTRRGVLVDGVASSLLVEDFEAYLRGG